MTNNKTFSMIKPDGVENRNIGAILDKINKAGFKIIALKLTHLTINDAKSFYSIHSQRPFFNDLISFITRGPIVAMVLEKDNAVDDFRTLIGSTNPIDAAEGTIRKLFAKSVGENAIHGSDSNENSEIECSFHFSKREIFNEI
ncbi:MAG: nucleoside-diphosphate kinase [Flavobacteriaceae bacterium]|nr:nucleoside-diphosphate kinase [Flavobacteriaceae bacterium]